MLNAKRYAAFFTAIAAAVMTSCGSAANGEAADIVTSLPVTVASDAQVDDDVPICAVFPDDNRLTPPTLIDDDSNKYQKEGEKPMDKQFSDAEFDLSAELFRRSCMEALGNGSNAMVSPWSVMQALGLAANGADGETLVQLEALLGSGMELADINEYLSGMIASAESSEDVKLGIANSIWVDSSSGFALKKSYIDTCLEKLDAQSFAVPFDQSGADELNAWVAEKTDDMIVKLIDSFDPSDRAVLVNCLVFKGEWDVRYDELCIDENAEFTGADGEKQDCTMLFSTEKRYLSAEGVTGFIKPYEGGKYAFAALLPDEDNTLSDLVCSLDGSKLSALLNGASDMYEVQAYIPEFKFDFGKSIAKELAAMGLDKAFTDEADLSRMSDEELFIGDVIHKTYIELDRTGTKAAAATGMMIRTMSLESVKPIKTVRLDRPFMFAIIDTENGLPVFIGAVNSVK